MCANRNASPDPGGPAAQWPGDRGALRDLALGRLQLIEARGQERLDRWRHRELSQLRRRLPAAVAANDQTVVDEHAHELLDEQRIALRRGQDPLAEPPRERRRSELPGHELVGRLHAERLE